MLTKKVQLQKKNVAVAEFIGTDCPNFLGKWLGTKL
jgi:hypothetical protein